MRILAFNHFFDQDLDALRARLRPNERIDVLPYQRLHRLSRRFFPAAAYLDLEAPYEKGMAGEWDRFRPAAQRFADWLIAAYRPHVFLVPNDSFFYLRPVIEHFRARDVATVVVQKETTISPMTMELDSQQLRRSAPLLADTMTVCSERHRQFWLEAGTRPEQITVTGQPRFDVYAGVGPARRSDGDAPMLLYFSYDDIAYLPPDAETSGRGTWKTLRRETEEVLAAAAGSGHWRVMVKQHPQQVDRGDWLGPLAVRTDRGADTRGLILAADAIVGFQTTALLEAGLVGRPLIYAAWGAVYERNRPLLVPFDRYGGLTTHAHSPAGLTELLARPIGRLPLPDPAGLAIVHEHLGPVDGMASERALAVVRSWARCDPPAPPRVRSVAVASAALRTAGIPAAACAAYGLRLVNRSKLAGAAARRRDNWAQEGREAIAIMRRPGR